MSSVIEICNLALASLGQDPILNYEDPQTKTAQLCATYYPICRDALMEAHNWTFAVKRAVLTLQELPAPLWGFSYSTPLPNDCIRTLWIGRQQDEFYYDPFPYAIEGESIVSNEQNIYLRYIYEIENTSKFSPLFCMALAARMAMEMCVSITENVGLFERLTQVYAIKLAEAISNDGAQSRSQIIKQRVLSNSR